MPSRSTSPSRHPLPCIYLLPLIFCLTILNKSVLTPPQTTFIRVTGFSHSPSQRTSRLPHTQVNTIFNIRVHPLSQLLHKLVISHNTTSLLAFPCQPHVSITHPLLQLLQHTGHLTNFQYICQDPDSRSLANAHAHLSHNLPHFAAVFRRGNFSKLPIPADVLLTGAVNVENVRNLLLKATSVGVRFTVLHCAPMPGLPSMATDDPIIDFRTVYSDAPFPFAHALVGASRAYGYGEHFVLVYDLTYLPRINTVTNLTRIQVERDLVRANIRP